MGLKLASSSLLEGLNEDQIKPVLDYKGPSFVVAGPGSGKTFTIVQRAAYMIEQGVNPENMLLFTFTRKAAGELKERIEKKIGKKSAGITVGTYHSVCARFLREYAEYLGYDRNFSIYDEEDKIKLLKTIVDSEDIKPEIVSRRISDWKGRMLTPDQVHNMLTDRLEIRIADYYTSYRDHMVSQNAFDFDDLIYATIKLFQAYPSLLSEVTDRYHYITADEFQDSGDADIELIRLLAGERHNVCMILDDEQSIYSFRGSNVKAVLNMRSIFPDLKEFILKQNYRSTQTIVNAARSLVTHNTEKIDKEIFTENPVGEKVLYFECPNPQSEANVIVKSIMSLVKHKGYKKTDIAILYRMSYLSRSLEESLLKNGIPYTVVGGTPFYARKEIKDIMSYIRFAFNPQDVQAFERIINVPKRGIGKKGLEEIYSLVQSEESGKIDIIKSCSNADLKGRAKKGIQEFVKTMKMVSGCIDENLSPKEIVSQIIKHTDYCSYLMDTEKEAEDKIANVVELQSIAEQYDTVDDFIYNMSLNASIDEGGDENEKVQLLTMHASKGLEFKAVFTMGINQGTVPHWKADTVSRIEEERRLFYVALTRAEEMLFITRSKIGFVNGGVVQNAESKFIGEIDEAHLQKVEMD